MFGNIATIGDYFMYDVRQFRPVLYALLILGFSGFALAAQAPGLWLLAIGAVGLNAWLIRRGLFSPLPRILANLITLSSLLYIVIEVKMTQLAPILVIGQFLVLLQLVKLFEQRANRDYAQLLVLSLLLVVAASINTASLLFGLVLIVYLFLSLYCCLLFHLKVESDHARVAIAMAEEKLNPAALRHDQRYLSRSMRKLTVFVSTSAVAMAVLVFMFFPRGTGANLLAPLQTRAAQTLTGFSDNVSFQNIARISQNNEVVAHVRVWHTTNENGSSFEKRVEGTQPLLLRGTTLNYYHGGDDSSGATWQWERRSLEQPIEKGGDTFDFFGTGSIDYAETWRQEIWLSSTGTNVLFALAGPIAVKTDRDMPRVRYFNGDEVMQVSEMVSQPIHYEVVSRGSMDFKTLPRVQMPVGNPAVRPWWMQRNDGREQPRRGTGNFGNRPPGRRFLDNRPQPEAPATSAEAPVSEEPAPLSIATYMVAFRQFAANPAVSGSNETGPLFSQRRGDRSLDSTIASHIANYLRSNYRYSLDLTDVRKLGDGRDPLLAFLIDFKKGHCEYFAGAMTLLCQSLGMDARMVVGFRCDEYNSTPGADYYIVRQSHAHAWVEVRTPDGWETFDPTSSREAEPIQQAGMWQKVKHLMDYLEYTWANNVVGYDREDQGNVIKNFDARLANLGIRGSTAAVDGKAAVKESFSNWLRSWFTENNFFIVSSKLLSGLIYLAFFAAFGAVGGFVWQKWKLRQRARRIGLENLPASAQLRLARQLGFYDDLMKLLERYDIRRPRHLTPMEFSSSIAFLPSESYDAIHRLTHIFYRIRYGGHQITYGQRQRLGRVIQQIDNQLSRRSQL